MFPQHFLQGPKYFSFDGFLLCGVLLVQVYFSFFVFLDGLLPKEITHAVKKVWKEENPSETKVNCLGLKAILMQKQHV